MLATYAYDPPDSSAPQPAINLSVTHGVRSSLALARTHDREQMLAARNRDVAPNIAFADVGGRGYAVAPADVKSLEVEFVCLPRPIERTDRSGWR